MYSNKANVNILTALLVSHQIERVVVCPGSRNVPLVNNLHECPSIACYPVTDERSAGFYALGLIQATGLPVAVCVTSGSALLNLSPAVAEAFYQHLPLIVIAADRPAAWIDQLDGQTLPQGDALGKFVGKAVTLPEPKDDTESWYCNRLVNEALYSIHVPRPHPVLINVPISEPLFDFSVKALPHERKVRRIKSWVRDISFESVWEECFHGELPRKPMIIVGQVALGCVDMKRFAKRLVVLNESLSCNDGGVSFDEVLYAVGDTPKYVPDCVVYIGDTIVSKRLRKWLRKSAAPAILLTLQGCQWADPTMSLGGVVECPDWHSVEKALDTMFAVEARLTDPSESSEREQGKSNWDTDEMARYMQWRKPFYECWTKALRGVESVKAEYEPRYSQMAAVKYFEQQFEDVEDMLLVHYANSQSVRLANIYSRHYVWCNRGVNGIEGCLSTAAGFSLGVGEDKRVVCVIGDLSFFYDQNALWNQNLSGNLRIILLNNHGGGIFRQLPGLTDSTAANRLVCATHPSDAQGICAQNDIGYIRATTMEEMRVGIVTLITREAARPMLLEIVTDMEEDAQAVRVYYNKVKEYLMSKTIK